MNDKNSPDNSTKSMTKRKEEFPLDSFGPVKIDLDDIEFILSQLGSITDDGELELIVGDYELSSSTGLSELSGQRFEELQITSVCHVPYNMFRVLIDKSGTSVVTSSLTSVTELPYIKIREYLKKRIRRWKRFEIPYYGVLGSGFIAIILIIFGEMRGNDLLSQLGFGMVALIGLASILFLITIPYRKSEIILLRRGEIKSFWSRNQDRLLVALISSILSFILGVLAALLFNR